MPRILLTGGGSGGHVYPLLAVADALAAIAGDGIMLSYVGTKSTLNNEFTARGIPVCTVASSKLRRYAAIQNVFDIPKFFVSIVQALAKLYAIMPDVVFSKGGSGALPVVLAARFYRIPVLIHESDSVPGLTNRFCGKFAARIGVSFANAADYFDKKKVALVGNPIRPDLLTNLPDAREAKKKLGFNPDEPLVVILGGSQGSVPINTFILDSLKELLAEFQVFHQVGMLNEADAKQTASYILKEVGDRERSRYQQRGFLNLEEEKTVLSAADVVISRAGAGAIFELAAFGKPAILIPLDGSANDHQRLNAYEYHEKGGAIVIQEENLKIHVVIFEIKSLLQDQARYRKMADAARAFAKPHAAEILAKELLSLGAR